MAAGSEAMDAAFEPLREQILTAAREFRGDADGISELLEQLVGDVERVVREPLTVLPVAHHSPAAAVHMVKRLRESPPRVIFVELCEDLAATIGELKDCKLPVALQAFANASEAFPKEWTPLSVVAPLTEFSAEYQAIAYGLAHKDVEVVFVDRSVDHIFQWHLERDASIEEVMGAPEEEEDDEDEELLMHTASVGLEIGQVVPSFDEFREFLLDNARVNHFSEWWDLYVEQPTIGASFDAWRQAMILVGSLIRRIGTREDVLAEHQRRERYMWSRMKAWLLEHEVAPQDAVYICGAAHAASDVAEWGTATLGDEGDPMWEIPASTDTEWLYGFIPSSYAAIEHQFGHPRGTLTLAENTWSKGAKALSLKPFTLSSRSKGKKKARAQKATAPAHPEVDLASLVTRPPTLHEQDKTQLLDWCTRVVAMARKNRYLASTADAIAIYETSMLLAGMRGRRHPSPWDFVDAAVTCLEKTDVPGRKDVRQICGEMIGSDRVGQVGYSSLPPLVQDIYDRLAPIGLKPKKTRITRWLADFRTEEDKARLPISDLLWRINYLLPNAGVARPIMGELQLGGKRVQESWDVKIHGPQQRAVIQLAYEGVTVEQVLEQRIKRDAFKSSASTLDVLAMAEDAILLANSPRLVEELGERAVHLLTHDVGAQDAKAVFGRVRRLVHYYRSTPDGLPRWLEDFVASGYQHYATLLPQAFADRGTSPEQLSGMLAFLFNLESLALALGCNRSQVLIAIEQAGPITVDPPKLGLLWASEWLLQMRDGTGMREEFDQIIDNPMSLSAFPEYLGGFLLALNFTPLVAPLAVELLSRSFSDLPDAVLLPWLPGLVSSMRELSPDVLPSLFKEAFRTLPRSLGELDAWTPSWEALDAQVEAEAAPAGPTLSDEEVAARALLFGHRATAEALAERLGEGGPWVEALPSGGAPAGPTLSDAEMAARDLLFDYKGTAQALAERLGEGGAWVEALPSGGAAPAGPQLNDTEAAARDLLFAHKDTAQALAGRLGDGGAWVEALSPAGSSVEAAGGSPEEDAARALLEAHPASMEAWASQG